MKVKSVLKSVEVIGGDLSVLNVNCEGVKIDNRKIEKGDIFIALKGENFDGNAVAEDALKRGASVVISDRQSGEGIIQVDNARSAYALISKNLYGGACDKMKIIAVTGTNGKTTTCNCVADILRSAGKKVGVIGTLGASVDGEVFDTGMTTPDPDVLHQIFDKMQKSGCEYVVMEASAHALALDKLDGIKFELGVLTNITEDHLDFFGDMETYAKAKFRLFEEGRSSRAIICKGKTLGEEFLSLIRVPFETYGLDKGAGTTAKIIRSDISGNHFVCTSGGEDFQVRSPLVGEYNLENLLATIAICKNLGLSNEEISKGASCTLPVEGRFNVLKMGDSNIVIDFAHTPDGLEKVLTTARGLSKNKLVVIFGCGGNRDRKKRPIMGDIASRLADVVILTSDNPRFEHPLEIIREIRGGVRGKCTCIADRKRAIEYALKKFCNGETIVIAGKGGERYQDIGGVKEPYNDFDVVGDFYREKIGGENTLKKSDCDDAQEKEIE